MVDRPGRRHGSRGARVQEIEVHLGRVDPAAPDHPEDGRCLAQRGDPEVPEQALAPQLVEDVEDASVLQYLVGSEHSAVGLRPDLVVELEQRHALHPQAAEALVQAALDLPADVGEVSRVDGEFRRDVRRRAEFRQQFADRFLRASVAVLCGRVDPVDPGIEGHPQGGEPRLACPR